MALVEYRQRLVHRGKRPFPAITMDRFGLSSHVPSCVIALTRCWKNAFLLAKQRTIGLIERGIAG
jgi:hypothetical protein